MNSPSQGEKQSDVSRRLFFFFSMLTLFPRVNDPKAKQINIRYQSNQTIYQVSSGNMIGNIVEGPRINIYDFQKENNYQRVNIKACSQVVKT